MKIYEAIRKGSKRYPQAFGTYFNYVSGGSITGTCALGAALLAVLEEATHKRIATKQDIAEAMNAIGFDQYEKAEAISYFFGPDADDSYTITYWNDEQRLSREEIANRLEEMEA